MRKKELMMKFFAAGCIASISVGTMSSSVQAKRGEKLAYIKGRPLTIQEIQKMKENEPTKFVPMEKNLIEKNQMSIKAPQTIVKDAYVPVRYNLANMGRVTPAKDQGHWGTCWTFGICGSLESNMLTNNKPFLGTRDYDKDSIDLSERHLAYFTHHDVTDPLGLTEGDRSIFSKKNYLQNGGNSIRSTMVLASWKGVVEEKKAPYSPLLDADETTYMDYDLDDSLAYEHDIILKNMQAVRLSNRTKIKQMMSQYGAPAISLWWNKDFFNYDTCAYNQNENGQTNHMVTLVGWDDNYSKDNFMVKPESDGAWLCKNSWGEDWGDNGYFWISYEDLALQDRAGNCVYFYEAEDSSKYDNNYQYDGTTMEGTSVVQNGGKIANRFMVPYDAKGQDLKAVSIMMSEPDIDYTVRIYKNCNETDPTSGTEITSAMTSGNCEFPGYKTIELNNSVDLYPGETFSVVVELNSDELDVIHPYMERTTKPHYSNRGEVGDVFTNNSAPGQSFELNKNGKWEDFNRYQWTYRIKAFTTNKQY